MKDQKSGKEYSGNIVDVVGKLIFKGTVTVVHGKISSVREEDTGESRFILPGLVDAHIHIESSMLIPSEFARLAVVHGTGATVSDPHEIGNVLGMDGVRFMIENGKKVPFKFYFGAPSCVPATTFETSGATLGVKEVGELLQSDDIHYLSEMMNFPGVLNHDDTVMQKIALAEKYGKPVDGHAPGLTGSAAGQYIRAGISTDHECFSKEEALEKIRDGMKILIREGSAAKNFEALSDLIDEYPDKVMLCSDDKHPNDLREGHINRIVKRAIGKGYDIFNILRSCTLNPVRHYSMNAGLLQPGDPADFIIADDLRNFNILEVSIDGKKVAENGISLLASVSVNPVNVFHASPVSVDQIRVIAKNGLLKVIQAFDGQLITKEFLAEPEVSEGMVVNDPGRDILKIVVKDRYKDSLPSSGFVTGFGLKGAAIASSVAHDSHNIIAVGSDDRLIVEAINLVIEAGGGISMVTSKENRILPLPFAGIMSSDDGYRVAERYESMDKVIKEHGSALQAPFMTLSFMGLLVIPELKISDRGLFDGKKFGFTEIFVEGR